MIRRMNAAEPGFGAALDALLAFDAGTDGRVDAAVSEILAAVRSQGDAAVLSYTHRFDQLDVADISGLELPKAALQAALDDLPVEKRSALACAAARVRSYHERQIAESWSFTEANGTRLGQKVTPLDRVGLYVPGGKASYPSSVLMNAIPAKVAGVQELIMVTPTPRGERNPLVLAAAAVAGVDEVYAIGGAQAIGALAYGTEQVPAVDVICGPGNKYVALAKQEVAGTVGVAAAFAGPSEVVVIADGTVRPELAAVDVILQAEHGPDGLAWLISWDSDALDAIDAELARLTEAAPRRADITATLADGGYAVLVDSPAAAVEVANLVAPEHLELLCAGAEDLVAAVRNAGAIFVGPWSPASVGDYVAGPSHVLPTYGTARFSSALTVDDFLKHHHVITVDGDAFDRIGPAVQSLAEAEGLDAHAESIRIRRDLRDRGIDGHRGATS